MFVNEVMHPQAAELAKALGYEPDEERVYRVVGALKGIGENAKADLYARLVEADLHTLNPMDAGSAVSRALHQNQQLYPRGW